MSQKRDLGPILAIAGGAVAIAAVITGFIVIGGPGDARDRRLDERTMYHLYAVATMANCALALDGTAPSDLSAARASIGEAMLASPNELPCGYRAPESDLPGVEYTRIDDIHIRLCTDFRRPYTSKPGDQPDFYWFDYPAFHELEASRPAGRHCYDIELTRPPAPPPQ